MCARWFIAKRYANRDADFGSFCAFRANLTHKIDVSKPSEHFLKAWSFAGRDLSSQGQGALRWIRDHLHPPLVDHLSFRIGNQIFCVLLDVTGESGKRSLSKHEEDRLVAFSRLHGVVAPRARRVIAALHLVVTRCRPGVKIFCRTQISSSKTLMKQQREPLSPFAFTVRGA